MVTIKLSLEHLRHALEGAWDMGYESHENGDPDAGPDSPQDAMVQYIIDNLNDYREASE